MAATSSGVRDAQGKVPASLYGLGTDITIAKPATASITSSSGDDSGPSQSDGGLSVSPSNQTQYIDSLSAPSTGTFSPTVAAQIAKLHGVSAASGELAPLETRVTVPALHPKAVSTCQPHPKRPKDPGR